MFRRKTPVVAATGVFFFCFFMVYADQTSYCFFLLSNHLQSNWLITFAATVTNKSVRMSMFSPLSVARLGSSNIANYIINLAKEKALSCANSKELNGYTINKGA